MCVTCGCGQDHQHRAPPGVHRRSLVFRRPEARVAAQVHSHSPSQPPSPESTEERGRTIAFETAVLARNDQLAAHNRQWLRAHDVVAANLMSSPGSGKTTLLERTLGLLANELPLAVIEGDQETQADADRIRAAGGRALQINTGTGCHLDAAMIGRALSELQPQGGLLFIENIGNLVCPALFDLGEAARVVIASVTEGEDKPLKYPHMFRAAELVLLNKVDLLPHVDFSTDRFAANARRINPRARIVALSARSGQGCDVWLDFLRARRHATRAAG